MDPIPPPINLQPGQQPSPEQIQQMQAHMRADAERLGLTWEDYIERLKEVAAKQQAQAQAEHEAQQQQQGMVQQPVQPGPPKPEAVAIANFLRSQDLKMRTCIFQEKRKDMFRVKRAIRALQSPAYEKARKKNPLLPAVTDRGTAEVTFKQLPLSMLALRVEKIDEHDHDHEHEGHSHAKKKHVKGLWTVNIVSQQDTEDDMHYMWLYDGPAWKQRAYALGALALVMTLVMFPLWPLALRQGAWYLSMAFFGVVVLFFAMSIFRLILFCITMFSHPPGLWLFPNLFEDVGFFESFVPVWAWQEDKKSARKAKRLAKEAKTKAKAEKATGKITKANGDAGPTAAKSNSAEPTSDSGQQRHMHASVEEADDD